MCFMDTWLDANAVNIHHHFEKDKIPIFLIKKGNCETDYIVLTINLEIESLRTRNQFGYGFSAPFQGALKCHLVCLIHSFQLNQLQNGLDYTEPVV